MLITKRRNNYLLYLKFHSLAQKKSRKKRDFIIYLKVIDVIVDVESLQTLM